METVVLLIVRIIYDILIRIYDRGVSENGKDGDDKK